MKTHARSPMLMGILDRYWWWAVVLAAFSLIGLVIWFGVHVPFWDQWEMVTLFQKETNGTLGFSDFWAQHNEHRILFPNLITYYLAQLTGWDPFYETLVNVVLGVGSMIIILQLIRRSFSKDRLIMILGSVFAAWFMLSPIQWENWLWGWQIEWYLSVLAVVTTIWLLTVKELETKTVLLALLTAVVASYSLANGLVIWLIGMGILLVRKCNTSLQVLWGSSGVVSGLLYYMDYVNPPYHPSKTLFLEQPKAFIDYILSYIGSPLTYHHSQARYVGLVLMITFVGCLWVLWLKRRQQIMTIHLPWICLAVYALAGATLTAMSRLGFGVSQSYSSRYTTISQFFVLATLMLVISTLRVIQKERWFTRYQYGVLIVFVIGSFILPPTFNYLKGAKSMQIQSTHLKRARQCAQQARSENDPCLGLLYPNSKVVWERLNYLKMIGWGGF